MKKQSSVLILLILCTGCSAAFKTDVYTLGKNTSWDGDINHECSAKIQVRNRLGERIIILGPIVPLFPKDQRLRDFNVKKNSTDNCPNVKQGSKTIKPNLEQELQCTYSRRDIQLDREMVFEFSDDGVSCTTSPIKWKRDTDWDYTLMLTV